MDFPGDVLWSSPAEIVAAIAVLVTLWYLAIQLKQNTELERAELEVQLGLSWAELHDNMIQNPNLARAYERYIFGVLQIEAVLGWWQCDGSLTSREFQTHVDNLLRNPPGASWRQVPTSEMVPDID